MNKLIIVILVLIILFFVGGTVFLLLRRSSRTVTEDGSEDPEVNSANKWIPIVPNMDDGILELTGHRYVGFIKLHGINYSYSDEATQKQIENGIDGVLSVMAKQPRPYTRFQLTKSIHMENYLQRKADKADDVINRFPELEQEFDEYYEFIKSSTFKNGKKDQSITKKESYLLVSINDFSDPSLEMSGEERRQKAKDKFFEIARSLLKQYKTIGVYSYVCNAYDLVELFASVFHRENNLFADFLLKYDENLGEYLSGSQVAVGGDRETFSSSPNEVMVETLVSAWNTLNTDIINNDVRQDDISRENAFALMQALKSLEEEVKEIY